MCGCGSVAILAVLPMPLGSTVELFIPPAFAGPRGIPLIGTFPTPAEPAGRENAPIAAKPACPPPCPPRANEAAGGVKNMNNAIATCTEALDIGSTTMIHWNGEAMRERLSYEIHVGSPSAGTTKLCFRFRYPGDAHEVKGQGPDHETAHHLRRGKRQTAANGIAAKIQTRDNKKLGPLRVIRVIFGMSAVCPVTG